MPTRRPASSAKKTKKNSSKEQTDQVIIDPHQEEIDRLINEREQLRSKLNTICSKLIDNINLDNYPSDIDLSKQQPSDLSLDYLLNMIDEICEYRTAFLNLYQENDDDEQIPVRRKITQLAREEPELFRKHLTAEQRLTFVVRERDVWKENAELLQIMYATIVDQLEMGVFKKFTRKTSEILRAHRLNLEEVCLIFAAPIIRSITRTREKKTVQKKNSISLNEQQPPSSIDITTNSIEEKDQNISSEPIERPISSSSTKTKRNVSFAEEVNVFYDNKDFHQQVQQPIKEKILPSKPRLPLGNEISVDQMDSNLRMLIVKELSKDSQVFQPASRKSAHSRETSQPIRVRKKYPEWVSLAQLIGIDPSEIDHWLSQSLQYPASRVLSTWCNSTSPSPTVAQLHSLISSNELNRSDLAREIETMYHI